MTAVRPPPATRARRPRLALQTQFAATSVAARSHRQAPRSLPKGPPRAPKPDPFTLPSPLAGRGDRPWPWPRTGDSRLHRLPRTCTSDQGQAGSPPAARYAARRTLCRTTALSSTSAVTAWRVFHEDAWKKTAAYKMLNETPLGEMLEAVATQLTDKALASINSPNRKVGAARPCGDRQAPRTQRLCLRGELHREGQRAERRPRNGRCPGRAGRGIRQPFSRLMGTLIGTSKPLVVKKAGRNVIVVPIRRPKKKDETWAWWAEGDDLVVADIGKQTEDAIMAVIDGKTPNAVDNPTRHELAGTEGS